MRGEKHLMNALELFRAYTSSIQEIEVFTNCTFVFVGLAIEDRTY